jgi:hypothetical protein
VRMDGLGARRKPTPVRMKRPLVRWNDSAVRSVPGNIRSIVRRTRGISTRFLAVGSSAGMVAAN